MRSILRYALIFAISFTTSALMFSWPDVRPYAVEAIVIALRVTAAVLTACACALSVGFTWWRLSAARADTEIARQAVEFARELSSPVLAPAPSDSFRWRAAYLQFCFIADSVGTMSARRMEPYFERKAQVYWQTMTGALKAAGWAYVDDRGVTRFRGHFKAFHRLIARGALVLPCPDGLDPPVMRWIRGGNTVNTITLENTP